MTIANTFAAKASVAFVAVAMALMMVAPAQAQTAEELQAQIDTLMATIASLQAQAGGTATVSADAYVFTRSLTIGSQGADVTALQNYLIGAGFSIPAGATGYFGAQTQAAVAAWQTANGVMPAAGYFGPISQAKYNALMAAMPDTDDGDADSDEDDSDSDADVELSGEASLDTVEIDEGDDDEIEEGQEAAPVADITLEFSDGDAEVSRIDIALESKAGNDGDNDPWDVFEEVSLWVDGDEIASIEADDEDNYLDEDNGSLRFSDLDFVAMEDEEVVVTVAVTPQGSVDGADDGETWQVAVGSIRFVDADDVTTTEDNTGDQAELDGDLTGETVAEFEVEEAGAGDDLDLKSSSNNPDADTLPLDEDDTTEHEVFAFELDADDSDGDVSLEGLTIDLALSSTSRALNEVVKDVRVEIDGTSFSADDFDGDDDTEAVNFDIDGDAVIAAGETAEVVVVVEFEDMDGDSDLQGVTLTASVDTADVDAEGEESGEGVTIGGSDQDGDAQTLRSEGLVLEISDEPEATEKSKTVSDTSLDYGQYVFEFDVTAFGEDFYVDEAATTIDFDLLVDGAASTTGYTANLDIADADDAGTSDFVIEEGTTATFTLTIETNTGHSGSAEVIVNSLAYSAADDGTEELTVAATPDDDWTSDALILN